MNKLLILALFGLLCTFAVAQNEDESATAIDQAADLLKDLLDDAQKNLAELNTNWDNKKPILQQNIDTLTESEKNKEAECDALEGVLADKQDQLAKAEAYAKWLEGRITANIDLIASLLEKRCAQNTNYVEGLKNDKIALKLIDFLRAQIQNKEDFSLAQRTAFKAKLSAFLTVYARGNLAELVQLEKQFVDDSQYDVATNTDVQGRTSDEIGSGHVDNNQGDLELDAFQNGQRKGWAQVKAELLQLLDNLEATIKAKIAQAQEDEVNSNVAAADFKLKLEQEIQIYQKDLVKVQKQILGLIADVAAAQANVDQCNSEEITLEGQLAAAIQELADETAQYQKKNADISEEISIFQEVIGLYDNSTASQEEAFKDRADDYIDNQNFDEDQYDDREVPKIDLLNSSA